MTNENKNVLPNGSVIAQYKIESLLGSGGFGLVYKACHRHLGSVVAIKEYLPILATREGTTVEYTESLAAKFKGWDADRKST